MSQPTLTDSVFTLFERFQQERMRAKELKRGHPLRYSGQTIFVFFVLMQFRRIYAFKAQWWGLRAHPEVLKMCRWDKVPHRKTISNRYKALYPILQAFIQFVVQDARSLDTAFSIQHFGGRQEPAHSPGSYLASN